MMRFVPHPALLRAGLRYQLRHRWQAALALIGITMGVAVVLAVDLASAAARASFALSAAQLQGKATHRLVGAAEAVPDALYRQLFTAPGHPPIAPVIDVPVRVDGHAGRMRLIGVDVFAEAAFRDALPQAIRGEASLADWLARPDAIALSTSAAQALGVGPGDRLILRRSGSGHPVEVFAVLPDDSLGSRDILLADIATAQAIAGLTGKIGHIDLILDEGAKAWLAGRLPPAVRLVDIGEQTAGVAGMSAAFELNLTAMSLLALLVGMFLVFNAISFSIVQRRNLLGRLRALGVTRHEILRVVLAEASALGLVGSALGILLGIWLGNGLTQIVATTFSELYYRVSTDALHLGWPSLAKALALGLGGTLAAAWLPARQAAHTPPLTSLSRSALEQTTRRTTPVLAAIGTLLGIGGLWLAFGVPGGVIAGFIGLFAMLLGAALATPLVLRLAHAVLVRIPGGVLWRMASRDLDRHLSRLSTATAALMVALAASVGVAVMVESMRGAVDDWLGALLTADLYITAPGHDEGVPLPGPLVARVTQLAPVAAASRYRNASLNLAGRPVKLIAADLAAPSRVGFQLLDSVTGDPWAAFARGAILISEPLAHRLHLGAGDGVKLPTPQGEVGFTVAAVFRDYASEHGRIFMPIPAYRSLWEDMRTDTLALFARDGNAGSLIDAVRALPDEPAPVLTAAREIHAESMAVFDRTFRITEVLRYLSLLVAVIGVFSALMAIQLERRKEFAVLRALGLARGQIGALIGIESALLGLLAAGLAVPVGLLMAWVLTDAIQVRAFGWSMPFAAPLLPLLLTLAYGLGAALLASVYPAWRSGWQDPAPQLREE